MGTGWSVPREARECGSSAKAPQPGSTAARYVPPHVQALDLEANIKLPVAIEICDLNGDDLNALAKKTCILITTVGPYGLYGEHVSALGPAS